MISEDLLSLVRCPVCLEVGPAAQTAEPDCRAAADALSRLEAPDHRVCAARYEAVWRCPESVMDKRRLIPESEDGLRCACCGKVYALEKGYADLRPPSGTFSDLTQYAEESFHHRPGPLRPLFLSARIKTDMMRRMLKLSPDDRVVDVGCGDGRVVYFERERCGRLVGIDAGEHFAPEAQAAVDLARGDIRRLPFAAGSFDKAYSLDVMEHLPEDGVRAMLAEARRLLTDEGRFFIYSHVMMSSGLASFQRGVNRLVRWLDERGWVDNTPERERKSDHVNALRSYEQLEQWIREAGFRIETIRYYNVVAKALIEDLVLPILEHNLWGRRRRAEQRDAEQAAAPASPAPSSGSRPDVGRWAHAPLALATYLMKLDVALFGRVRTGPFFLLLRAVDSS